MTIKNDKGNEIKGSLSKNNDKESFVFKPNDSQQLKGTVITIDVKSETKEEIDNKLLKDDNQYHIPNKGTMLFDKNGKDVFKKDTDTVMITIPKDKEKPQSIKSKEEKIIIQKEIEQIKEKQQKIIEKEHITSSKPTVKQPYVLPQTGATNEKQTLFDRIKTLFQ